MVYFICGLFDFVFLLPGVLYKAKDIPAFQDFFVDLKVLKHIDDMNSVWV